jgi:hypothetical protein
MQGLAFLLLFGGVQFLVDMPLPARFRWVGFTALLLFCVGMAWEGLRNKKYAGEYKKLDSAVADGVKGDISTDHPANSH